jgi:hypothetical protein
LKGNKIVTFGVADARLLDGRDAQFGCDASRFSTQIVATMSHPLNKNAASRKQNPVHMLSIPVMFAAVIETGRAIVCTPLKIIFFAGN